MANVQAGEYSSDETGRSVQSTEDVESEYTSCNESKKRGRKPKHRSKLKSKANISEKSGSKKKSNRRKSSCDDSRYESDDMKNKMYDNNDSYLKVDIKHEVLSDDAHSAMSDINPPSLLTRLRQRKLERRRASRGTASTASTCSTLDSDVRKTQSEPILITIDSDSEEDEAPTVTVRPNRTARVHGEIVRKFSKLTRSNVEGCKYAETTEYDSEDENVAKKKRKRRKKSIKLMSISPEMNKPVSSRSANKRKLDAKKLGKTHIHVYTPLKQTRRLKIRNLRKRFEQRQKKITLSKRAEVFLRRTSSRLSAVSADKRQSPRRSSLTTGLGTSNEEKEPAKVGRPKRKVSSSQIKNNIKDENANENLSKKKMVDNNDIEDDIRKIISASKPNLITEDKSIKSSSDVQDMKSTVDTKSNFKASDGTKSSQNNIDNSIDTNQSADSDSGKADNDAEMKCEDPLLDSKKDESKRSIESDLEKIRTNTPDTMIEAPVKNTSDEERKTRNGGLSGKSKSEKGSSHKKKNIKVKTPIPGIIRKRGRPRLSESNQNIKPIKGTSFFESHSHVAFLQNTFCFDVASKLSKCRECRLAMHRTNRRMYNSYCRFMEYRKLCFSKTGQIFSAGFSHPSDATNEHLSLWLPQPQDPPKDLNFETAKSLLEHTGDQFCDLIEQEKEALSLHIGDPQFLTWKRIVQGVREMCDVCSTTIFNIHWVCPTCGFSVCIDCYKVRKLGVVDKTEADEEQPKDRDEFNWLLCTMRQPHDQKGLVLTQMIPGDALWIMKDLLHKARLRLGIPSYCKCNPPVTSTPDKIISTGINKQLMSCVTRSFTSERNHGFSFEKTSRNDIGYDDLDIEVSDAAMRWLEGNSMHGDNMNNNLPMTDDAFNSFEDFNLLSNSLLLDNQDITSGSESEGATFSLDDIIASVTKSCQSKDPEKNISKQFNKRYPQPKSGRDPLPIRIYTKIESDLAFSTVPHSWFCNGRLLFLEKSDHKDNLALFQEQWKRGQPVLVKNVQKNLDMTLWHPDGFCRDFGDVKNDLVDCKTGAILKSLPMRRFWEGFENFSKRLTDENNEYMLLKLKDWPPGEDFSEKLPTRFEDLMKGLPLPEYTHRNGILNLAGRLPSFFVRPDLGPKMYNAYGSALYPTKGTTNLHLDVSDAVNVMVYVGIPLDGNSELHIQEALKAIDEGGCDSLMRARVRQRDTKPGALWHIYNARDADKIRELLNKVAVERGEKLEAHNDPIHDQSWYLDTELRLRLYREYGVEGYAIAQCLGDAVFIPAGAPHQVRNLHSCVKVAEDFVSPENIAHCFKLTQEFRNLSDTHTNHEDKLQIKNIIYHVIKDSLSHLLPTNETIITS
ncbi:lysine-specific demethylase 3A-like [Argiope bruennichi]|uniref:lysine-specific demethylase 3A-like n=1 Tax=Argiope bruennichi TaxID=94029 RepID=UPI002494DE2A|nr:lysine-specific demethylase 3A-like [Argiope bruennichi]